MKKLVAVIMIAFMALLVMVLPTGCGTTNKATYKITGVAHVTVDAAMSSWGSYVEKFRPSVEQETAVKAAYEKYQTASLLVIDSAIAYRAAKVTKSEFDANVAAAASALSGLIGLIQQFGVTIKQ